MLTNDKDICRQRYNYYNELLNMELLRNPETDEPKTDCKWYHYRSKKSNFLQNLITVYLLVIEKARENIESLVIVFSDVDL